MATETALPTDSFSQRLRELTDNPGAVRASSRISVIDFLGHSSDWLVDTFRVDGKETVFLQRISADGSVRMVIPPEVADAMARQRERATTINRKRGARQAVQTKLAKGHTLGNVDALARARRKTANVARDIDIALKRKKR